MDKLSVWTSRSSPWLSQPVKSIMYSLLDIFYPLTERINKEQRHFFWLYFGHLVEILNVVAYFCYSWLKVNNMPYHVSVSFYSCRSAVEHIKMSKWQAHKPCIYWNCRWKFLSFLGFILLTTVCGMASHLNFLLTFVTFKYWKEHRQLMSKRTCFGKYHKQGTDQSELI